MLVRQTARPTYKIQTAVDAGYALWESSNVSTKAQRETRLKSLIQTNGTAMGVDLRRVAAVEKVTGQAVYSTDQPAAHIAFAYLRTQGSPIFPTWKICAWNTNGWSESCVLRYGCLCGPGPVDAHCASAAIECKQGGQHCLTESGRCRDKRIRRVGPEADESSRCAHQHPHPKLV